MTIEYSEKSTEIGPKNIKNKQDTKLDQNVVGYINYKQIEQHNCNKVNLKRKQSNQPNKPNKQR